MIGDVTLIVGRSFLASSGNTATAGSLGPGGLSVSWRDDPSPADAAEFDAWATGLLRSKSGGEINVHSEINDSVQESLKAYEQWRKTQ